MIEVMKPGLYTTIQDQGRYGYQASGIVVSGVMDKRSYELGNIILQQQNLVTQGVNSISLNRQLILAPGTYMIQLINDGELLSAKYSVIH